MTEEFKFPDPSEHADTSNPTQELQQQQNKPEQATTITQETNQFPIYKDSRKQMIYEMTQYMAVMQNNPGGDFEGQAQFYCEENNYDLDKAKQAFDQDRAFEE